jgi:hypothetical protein
MRATWKPHEKHGKLTAQSDLPDSVYAFPKERKEPLTDARHVRNAIARFDQVIGASDADRSLAFANIKKAAAYYGVKVSEKSWHDLGKKPQKGLSARTKRAAAKRTPAARSKSARTGVATRKKLRKKAVKTRKTGSRRKST